MSLVRATVDGSVGLLELRRPERHNSLIPELLEDLIAAHREIVDGGAVAGVLAAAGPTFSCCPSRDRGWGRRGGGPGGGRPDLLHRW